MKILFFLLFTQLSWANTDLLIIGDSQTGATWAKSYFGNFLQKCLKKNESVVGNFVSYARGGTQPTHWVNASSFDSVETIQRDNHHNHKNIGAYDAVPLYKRRITPILEHHNPRKMFLFFGDNLLGVEESRIAHQIKKILEPITAKILPENCFFLTPTYEMQITQRRNVRSKTKEITKKVNDIIKRAIGSKCTFIDGLELMKTSPYLLPDKTLKRELIQGLSGCGGANGNDNLHLCGRAAEDLANRVCSILVKP